MNSSNLCTLGKHVKTHAGAGDEREDETPGLPNIKFGGHKDAIKEILNSPNYDPIPAHACIVSMDLGSVDLKYSEHLPFLTEFYKLLYMLVREEKRKEKYLKK